MYVWLFYILLVIPLFLGLFTTHYIYLDVYSFIIFFIAIIFLAIQDKKFSILVLYLLIAFTSTLFISLFIEKGVFLIEIFEFSYATGITYKAAFSAFSFLLLTFLIFKFLLKFNLTIKPFHKKQGNYIENICRFTILLACFILFLLMLQYGFPIFTNIHRADFWFYHAPKWGYTIATWLIQLSFILGFLFSKDHKKIDLIIFFILLFISILAGSRFTGIMVALVYFFTPILFVSKSFKFHNFKFIISFAIILFGLLFLVQNTFDSSSNQTENTLNRVVLQSQMWWALDKQATWFPQNGDLIFKSYFGFTDNIRDKDINYLMYLVAPINIVEEKVANGSAFTMSSLFNNYYYFGYFLGYLVNLLWAVFFGIFIYLIHLGLSTHNNVIYSFFSFKLMLKFQSIFLTANTSDIFGISTLFFLFIMLFFLTINKRKKV